MMEAFLSLSDGRQRRRMPAGGRERERERAARATRKCEFFPLLIEKVASLAKNAAGQEHLFFLFLLFFFRNWRARRGSLLLNAPSARLESEREVDERAPLGSLLSSPKSTAH